MIEGGDSTQSSSIALEIKELERRLKDAKARQKLDEGKAPESQDDYLQNGNGNRYVPKQMPKTKSSQDF
jgi:hypothetical protein